MFKQLLYNPYKLIIFTNWNTSYTNYHVDYICLLINCLICLIFRAIPGGEENGVRGYMLTYVIAYIRVS